MNDMAKGPPNPADGTSHPEPTRQGRTATPEQIEVILKLAALGFGTRRIAKKVGLGRRVVRGVLRPAKMKPLEAQGSTTPARKLDPFREIIQEKVEKGLTTTRILREIRPRGYQGGRTILGDWVRTLKPRTLARKRVWRRFETGPGKEMQVDWSPYRIVIQGMLRIVHAFIAILAYSRKIHVRFWWNERLSTLLEAQVEAFRDFGGVTSRVVYDRMATVVLGTIGKDDRPIWHPRFLDFCKHFGYDAFLCARRDPDRKGKCERALWYLEQDFIRGQEFDSLQDLNQKVAVWLAETANRRTHRTTGRVPDVAFAEEKALLIRLPDSLFPTCDEEMRDVGDDAVLWIRGTPYTIPAGLAVSRRVAVRLYSNHFEVLDPRGNVSFSRAYVPEEEKGRLQIDPAHYDGVARGPAGEPGAALRMEDRFKTRFPSLAELLAGLKIRMKTLFPVHLRALLRTADRWGDAAFVKAAEKAQRFRRFDAQAVRRILERLNPLPDEEPEYTSMAESRAIAELGDVDGGSLDDYSDLDAKASDDHEEPPDEEGPQPQEAPI